MTNPIVIISGARSMGKTRCQNLAILKEWPTGTIINYTQNGKRYSELADVEEIKD